jgi:ATP-dependent RNA helicase RhlE
LNDFTMGHIRVLVATDIAARGIDVSNITHVVNFDMPLDPETYVHRVGRTARKGNSGVAISLCDPSERQEITAIERMMKQKLEVIADVGGEALPIPERRQNHRAQNGQRRDGGRDAADRHNDHGDRRHDGRESGQRGERQARHRTGADRARAPSARHDDNRRPYEPVEIAAEGDAMFGVGERRDERRENRGNEHRPHRGNGNRPHNGERMPHERNGRGEHRANGHRNRDARPARDGDAPKPEHAHHGRRHEGGRTPERQNERRQGEHRSAEHRHSERRQNERGDRRPSWGSTDAPKFMKPRRDDGRGRQSRNPAT